ncbi:MAG: hypothetical protein KOO66_08580 [Bacteroidales bacterium]|nr:hypothetical protein [Bacteroidales bacterium]
MKIFKSYITPKIILKVLLATAIFGMISILFTINRMNSLLNTDLGFNKDSIYSIKTQESSVILPDTLVFSSVMPGFNVLSSIEIKSEYSKNKIELAHQYVSGNYFDLFNYVKLNEKSELLMDHGKAQLVYINEAAVEKLGIYCIDDAPGTRILNQNNVELVICGVVKDFTQLSINGKTQAIIYQLNSEHLAYAFYNNNALEFEEKESKSSFSAVSFQQRLQKKYKIWEDIIYSAFLFTNILVLLICLGFMGNKYASGKEKELFKILGIGVHILTLVISKTYIYLLAIMGFVAGPIAYLIQKLWLEIYVYKVQFGLIDLFIILSMALLTAYLVCCPKKKLEYQLRGKFIKHNSI